MFEGKAAGFHGIVIVFFDFDDVPLDSADAIDGGKHGLEIDGASADFRLILQVQRANTATLFADEFRGIFSADLHPIDIGLAAEVARGGGIEHPIKHAASIDDGELGGVIVVSELDIVSAKRAADDS